MAIREFPLRVVHARTVKNNGTLSMTAIWKGTDYEHIFQMAKFPPLLSISEELKQRLESARVTGSKFTSLKSFRSRR
jgi:hypothetical protein